MENTQPATNDLKNAGSDNTGSARSDVENGRAAKSDVENTGSVRSYVEDTRPVSKNTNPSRALLVLRPRQWTKNLIAYAPILFGGKLLDPDAVINTSICVVCLCLVSGFIYVANDIKDREADAKHPAKRRRPIASGQVSVRVAATIAVVALILGLIGGFVIRPTLCVVLLLYVVLQVVYNYSLKHQPILDIFSIAAGFILRALAGGAASHVVLSGWFILCASLGALFLAIEKRRQELKVLGVEANEHRKSLDKYSMDLIDRMEAVIVPSLVTSYAIYSFFSPSGQWMMLTLPFVLYGILRYQVLSTTKTLTGTPEEVLLKDRPIQLSILLWVLTSIGVVYNWIPSGLESLVKSIDSLFDR